MEIQDNISQSQNLYNILFEYIDNYQDDSQEYQNLTNFLSTHAYLNNVEQLKEFLQLITRVSSNHTREHNFLDKIYKILFFLKDKLILNFTKVEIFNFFKGDKILLLFLLTNIIEIDDTIINLLDQLDYLKYFYNIAKPFLDEEKQQAIERDLKQNNEEIFEKFDEKCKKGENDSFLCSLIRNDEVVQFIQYVNQVAVPLDSVINPSIFETNPFLLKNENKTTIIEYASFFGSIQIVQYLQMNSIELTKSAWAYSIHSNNAELYDLFEKNIFLNSNDPFYNKLLKEAVKCHHNEIANYLLDIYTRHDQHDMLNKYAFRYYNFLHLTCDMKNDYSFKNAIKYHHNILVKIIMNSKEYTRLDIDNNSILKLSANYNNQEISDIYFSKIGKIIKEGFFKNNNKMEKIIIPPTIVKIEDSAFQECISLKEVVIPPSVKKIGSFAFDKCPKLKNFQVDFDNTTDFGLCAYNHCQNFVINYQYVNIALFSSTGQENFDNLKEYFEKERPIKIEVQSYDVYKSIGTHIRFLFNSDIVFLFIDATKKINEQFFAEKCSVADMIFCFHYFQIKSFIIVVDKMDDESVNYSKERFDEIKNDMTSIFIQNGFDSNQLQFVPISEDKNENVENKSSNFSWWNGPTLNDVINSIQPPKRNYCDTLRFVVINILGDDYENRILSGIVCSGVLSMPCYLKHAYNENRNANFLYREGSEKKYAYPGEICIIKYFYYVPSKFDLLGCINVSGQLIHPAKCASFVATLIILNFTGELNVGWDPRIHFIAGYLKCKLVEIEDGVESKSVKKYEHVKVTFAPSDFIALETYDDYPNIGIFSIQINNDLQAIGMITSIEK